MPDGAESPAALCGPVPAAGGSQARASRQARYGRLYEELRRPARGMVRRAFGAAFGDDELEDLYSAAWLSTLGALERKERELDDDELRRYVMTAVANQASRELRRRGRKPTVPLEIAASVADSNVCPEEQAADGEQAALTREVLASLPPRRRAVMLFRYGWGLQPSEVRALVGGLSSRAYRKEIERGVAELTKKLRLAEDGEWCQDREPLLRAFAAGLAEEEEERQARQHISRCRSCADSVAKLSGALHDLGGAVAWAGIVEVGAMPDASVLERGGAVLERGKHLLSSALGRGGEAAQSAAEQVGRAGGSRGAGAAGLGVVAKLAGVGAAPKIVAACLGTGAAATACVAAGIAPGANIADLAGKRTERPAADRPADGAALVTDEQLRVLSDVSSHPDVSGEPVSTAAGSAGPSPTNPAPAPETAAPASAPAVEQSAPPTVHEFEPVGTQSSRSTAEPVTTSSSGGRGSGSSSEDFGP